MHKVIKKNLKANMKQKMIGRTNKPINLLVQTIENYYHLEEEKLIF
jgi:hypothetical protein